MSRAMKAAIQTLAVIGIAASSAVIVLWFINQPVMHIANELSVVSIVLLFVFFYGKGGER